MKAGDKVVCVDDKPRLQTQLVHYPNGFVQKGQVYAVIGTEAKETRLANGWTLGFDGIYIAGSTAWLDGVEVPWPADRFRLLSEVGHPPIAVEHSEPVAP